MPTVTPSSQSVRGVAFTTIIAAIFGLFWGFTGTAGLPPPFELLGLGLICIISLTLFAIAFGFVRLARRLPLADSENVVNPFRTRAYGISVLLMVLAFPIAGVILRTTGGEDALISVIAIIVGLHFFGLVHAFDAHRFVAIGGAMCLVGVISLGLPVHVTLNAWGSVALREAIVGVGCAFILWASAFETTISTWQEIRE